MVLVMLFFRVLNGRKERRGRVHQREREEERATDLKLYYKSNYLRYSGVKIYLRFQYNIAR